MAHYIVECLQLMALRGASTMEVTQQAHEDYVSRHRRGDEPHRVVPHARMRTPTTGPGRAAWWSPPPYRLVDLWQQHRAPIEEDFILR